MRATPRKLLVGALLCAVVFVALYEIAYEWRPGGLVDARGLLGFEGIQVHLVTRAAHQIQSLCEPKPYLVLAVVLVAAAFLRRGPVVAVAVLALLIAANASAEVLKPAIQHASGIPSGSNATVGAGSFPSGHATAAMSLALGVVIAAPAAYRALAMLGGGLFVLAISWSVLVLGSHLPSDVVGGYLVATFWALIVLAGMRFGEGRFWPSERRRDEASSAIPQLSLTITTALLVIAGSGVVVLALIRLRPRLFDTTPLIDFGAVGIGITLLVAGVIAGVAAVAAGDDPTVTYRGASRPTRPS